MAVPHQAGRGLKVHLDGEEIAFGSAAPFFSSLSRKLRVSLA
jgi:hypothetical protein